jgi:hypothetical protein
MPRYSEELLISRALPHEVTERESESTKEVEPVPDD